MVNTDSRYNGQYDRVFKEARGIRLRLCANFVNERCVSLFVLVPNLLCARLCMSSPAEPSGKLYEINRHAIPMNRLNKGRTKISISSMAGMFFIFGE